MDSELGEEDTVVGIVLVVEDGLEVAVGMGGVALALPQAVKTSTANVNVPIAMDIKGLFFKLSPSVTTQHRLWRAENCSPEPQIYFEFPNRATFLKP